MARYSGNNLTFGMSMASGDELAAELRELGTTKARAILRRSLANSTTPVVRSLRMKVKAEARDSGLLAKSIGKRVTTSRKTGDSLAVIGARRGFKQVVTVVRFGRYVNVTRNPTRYFHLVDKGTAPHDISFIHHKGRKVIIQHPGARGRHLVMDAFRQSRSEMNHIFETDTAAALRREAARLASKNRAK